MPAPKLKENFEGRIRNLALSPSKASNSLVPLFEAISNSIHAIQKRFEDKASESGRISILIERRDDNDTCSMIVSDNGVGLNDEQFDAFLTIDTSAKVKIGGKGIGRLTWLKVFSRAKIISRFQSGSKRFRRSFVFALDTENPIKDYKLTEASENIGTEIRLENMKLEYWAHGPSKLDTVAKKIIAHFFPAFFSAQMPLVSISMGDDSFVLNELLHEKIHRVQKSIFESLGSQVQIEHALIDKAIADHRAGSGILNRALSGISA